MGICAHGLIRIKTIRISVYPENWPRFTLDKTVKWGILIPMNTLKLAIHNHKLNLLARYLGLHYNQVVSVDHPAGYTCAKADICKAYANRHTGCITDMPGSLFRCYAANTEAYSPAARNMRWYNYDLLRGKSTQEITDIIVSSLSEKIKVVRIHSSGDFFSEQYFMAWVWVARLYPDITFYGYTKYLDYVRIVSGLNMSNFKLVYSYGGLDDSRLTNEPTCHVITSVNEGLPLGMNFACVDNPADDYNFIMEGKSFALALHGGQPKKGKQNG